MVSIVTTSRPRCLAVAGLLTLTLWATAAVLVRALAGGGSATLDAALVRLCLAALLAATAWAWLQGMAAIRDAWRGAPTPGRHHGVRRLVLAACGVALVGAVTAPAHAHGERLHRAPAGTAGVDSERPRPRLLSGLPLPDRVQGPAEARQRLVIVRPGDTLWSIAARDLAPGATPGQVAGRCEAIYRHNHGVIGSDPDLIRPGQVLRLTDSKE
jgi:hypothetical protein